MGNRDTGSGGYNMGGGDDDSVSGEAPAAFLESNIAVGMNMQHSVSSYHCNKMTNFMSPSSYYHDNHLHKHQASTEIGRGVIFGSDSGGVSGKVLFTATQWQELERQTMIYKYIMASIPIPPHLLIPFSTQSNKIDMRFSSGSDPEPWRCRRTDGKKWRCSRDVAPDQKYCERHAHKSRPRSRKPVEIQPHTTTTTTTTTASALNITPTYTNTLTSSSYQHPSWPAPVSSSSTQQFQQPLNSPRVGSKRNHIFPQEHESQNNYSNLLDTTTTAGARRQNFIDAWSRSGGGDNCSLTLSMQCSGGNAIDDDGDRKYEFGVGMLGVEREDSICGDVLKSHNQWLNQGSWMGSPPGGPLGEALGLGTLNGPLNVGHSSSSTTTSNLLEDSGSHGHGHELSFTRRT